MKTLLILLLVVGGSLSAFGYGTKVKSVKSGSTAVKVGVTSGTMATMSSGTLNTVNIPASLVTSGTMNTAQLGVYLGDVAASQIASGTISTARLGTVPGASVGSDLAASQISSGTFAQAILGTYLGSIAGSQVDSGTLATARIGQLPISVFNSGTSASNTTFWRGDGVWVSPVGSAVLNSTCDFRLSLTAGVPVTTSDVTAATNIYLSPYNGNTCALYDGSSTWSYYTSSEFAMPVPSGTLNVYDVFAYASSGTIALKAVQWTNNTTRAQAISQQNGVYVQTGTTANRYLGSFMQTGTSGQTEDSLAKRLLYNANNRVVRAMKVVELTDSWNYSTAVFRQYNNSTANQLAFLNGLSEDAVKATASAVATNSGIGGQSVFIGIGLDATNATSAQINGFALVTSTIYHTLNAFYEGFPGVGYHFLAPLEAGAGADTQTWTGDGGQVFPVNGIVGEIRN